MYIVCMFLPSVVNKDEYILVQCVLNGVHTSQDFLHFTVELDNVVFYHRICFHLCRGFN